MSMLRPKSQSCLPIKVVPWITTALARSKETLKEGATRPIHSYYKLGHRLSCVQDAPAKPTQKDVKGLLPRSRSSDMKVILRYLDKGDPVLLSRTAGLVVASPTGKDGLPELREERTPINMSDYINDESSGRLKSGTSYLQVMRKRHKNYLKKIKRGPSLSLQKPLEEVFQSEPASSLYVFCGSSLPQRSPSACSSMLNISMIRKRLSLGYTQNPEVKSDEKKPLGRHFDFKSSEEKRLAQRSQSPPPQPKFIVAQGRRVRLKPKKKP